MAGFDKKKGYMLIAEPGGGLCNRLISINNMIHLSKERPDIKVCIAWWREPECGCKYEDILKPISKIETRNFSRPMRSIHESLREGKIVESVFSFFQLCFFNYYYRKNNKNRIGGFYDGPHILNEVDLISIIENYQSGTTIYYRMGIEYRIDCVLSEENFSELVLEKLRKVKEFLNNKKYIGLHIRRTDHKQAIEASPLSFFEKAIEQELDLSKDACFFLATDDHAVEERLTRHYGEKILFYSESVKGRVSTEAMQDAAVELLMLAGAEKIYGSVGSTFSEMAAQIGKIPLILRL